MKRLSLRFIVSLLFLLFIIGVLGVTYYIQYNLIKKISEQSADTQFKSLSVILDEKLHFMDQTSTMYIKMFSSVINDKNLSQIYQNKDKYIKEFTASLHSYEDICSIYIGTREDGFFQVKNLDCSLKLAEKYRTSLKDKWVFIYTKNNSKQRSITVLDENLKPRLKKLVTSKYKPSSRIWFELAMGANSEIVKSDPYTFSDVKTRGITYSKSIGKDKVICVDIILKNINNILADNKHFKYIDSYIINKNGKIIAFSDKNNKNIVKKIADNIDFKKPFVLKNKKIIDGKNYVYYIKKIDENFILSIANLDDILEFNSQNLTQYSLIESAISFLVAMLMLWYIVIFIIKPILVLSQKSQNMIKYDFEEIDKIQSHIKEIDELSTSMHLMSRSIKNHQKDLEKKIQERTKELRKLSTTDHLTDVCNRMKIDENIELEIKRQNRYNRPFGVIMLDIDHFKKVNDTHSHQVGDVVLKEFAQILKNSVRNIDSVGRWGGEEFIIVCVEVNLEQLILMTKKLQTRIKEHTFTHIGTITASFGIAIHEKNEKLQSLIHRADTALYRAKESGRNRMEVG